ncbi:hypothetical protein NKH18_35750 [Streptomyces sp. M10(2022)]
MVLLGLDGFLRGDNLDTARWKDAPQLKEFTIRSYHAWGAASQAAWGISAVDIATVVEDVQHVAPGSSWGSNR